MSHLQQLDPDRSVKFDDPEASANNIEHQPSDEKLEPSDKIQLEKQDLDAEIVENLDNVATARGLLDSEDKMVKKGKKLQLDKKQTWRFFDNQVQNPEFRFNTDDVDDENWRETLAMDYSKKIQDVDRNAYKIIKGEDTYEPNILSYEMAEWIREERRLLRKLQDQQPEAGHDPFSMLKTKEYEAFQEMFSFGVEDEEGNVIRNYVDHSFPAFDSGACQNHRNALELFSYNEEYFVVAKSFIHKVANSRLNMKIFNFKPTPGDESTISRPFMCLEVDWPIVDTQTCFDPAMISVIQWNGCLYFFKIKNQPYADSERAHITTQFALWKFDMTSLQEHEVKKWDFTWEEEVHDHGSNQNASMSNYEDNRTHRAYAAIFLKVGAIQCEDENDFVNRRMLALLFEFPYDEHADCGDGHSSIAASVVNEMSIVNKPDRNFLFKIRRLAHFDNDLFYYKQPIPTNKQFRFQYFMEDSILQRQAFALINEDIITIVPVDLNEIQEVTKKEYYHYPERDCNCCNEKRKELAVVLKDIYLRNFKVLESFNERGEEEYRLLEIKKGKLDLVQNMVRHLEQQAQLNIDAKRDSILIILDKRTHRYLFFSNVMNSDKDFIKIYESSPNKGIRNAFNYNPDRLQTMARYDYHERKPFIQNELRDNNIDFKIQKQMFETMPNVVVEARLNDEGEQQFIVAIDVPETNTTLFQATPKEGGERRMIIGLDAKREFMDAIDIVDLSQKVHFQQVGWDDRLIMPRIHKDEIRKQFFFQLYNYKPADEQGSDTNLAETQPAIVQNDLIVDGPEIINDHYDKSRVIQELALDLSTSFLDFKTANTWLAPCTSVYQQNFGQASKEFVQDFQVLVYQRNCQMARIFQYRVFYKPEKNNKEMPYSVRCSLIGMKILIVRPSDSLESSGFYPMYNDEMEIIGTVFILNKAIIFEMPNFEKEEWAFSSDVVMSGSKFYYNQDNLDEEGLLMQAHLAEVLICREEFTESDHSMILKMQCRILMNMVPYWLDTLLVYDINESNFLQPLELLKTQSLLSIVLDDPGYVSDTLKALTQTNRDQPSIFEFFIKELNDKEREALFSEDYYIPRQEEVSRDIVCMNPLLRCFEPTEPMNAVLEKILEYMFQRPYSKNQSMIFIEIMPHMLAQQESSNEFAKFFIDSSQATINFNKIGSRLTVIIDHQDLPRYSNKAVTINQFTDNKSLGSQTDVNKWMIHYLIMNRVINETANVPVRHFYIDFRVMNLGFKLEQFRNGVKDIQVEDFSDYDLATYLLKICKIYGKDIEYQDSTRNIIDDMFIQVKPFFHFMLFYFIVFFFAPLCMQIFVFETLYVQEALNYLCLWAVIMYSLVMLSLLWYQKMDYFNKSNNLVDLSLLIVFFIYFGLKKSDMRIYLPEKILADGDFEFRRLAKGGSGASGGASSGAISGQGDAVDSTETEDATQIFIFDAIGSFIGNLFDFELRTVGRITFQAFVHTCLIGVCAAKFIDLISIYESFQTLIMVLKFTIKKSIPFWVLIYLWILCSSLMFRILGAQVEANPDNKEEYPFFGVFFISFLDTYKLSLGNDLRIEYPIWETIQNNAPAASRFAAVMIWVTWLINNFAIFIFGLNFLVSLISQGYEEALYFSRLEQYVYRCEKVIEATVLTKMMKQGRTLQTFSISIAQSNENQSWPGVVKSIKNYILDQNISLKSSLFGKIEDVEKSVNKKTTQIHSEIKEMRQQLTYVNEGLSQKLEVLAEGFKGINKLVNEASNRRDSVSASGWIGIAKKTTSSSGLAGGSLKKAKESQP